MAKYCKKPVVIEAVKYAGKGNLEALPGDVRGEVPEWLWEAFAEGTAHSTNGTDPLVIKTLEGDHIASPGDYIIQGVQGELYPCKPDIFEQTYEPVTEK